MSLYKSVLEVLHTDLCRLENSDINNILHNNDSVSTDPKSIGKASRSQWIRVFIGAISKWCTENPNSANAPESFLPDYNIFIRGIMEPGSVNLTEETED